MSTSTPDSENTPRSARVVAFYLPQFHPTAENNEWWGRGFTEWTNVTRAKPLFRGHHQPRLPADLGFYDLRVPEVREAQAELARTHGVTAFCYWHYWFAGRRILERPYNEVLASGRPDFPFCLAWANQTWSGIWHGASDKTLIEQTYPGAEDHRQHFQHVLQAFRDPRYLKVDGRPLFYIFRPEQLPDARAFTDRWRELADQAGLPGLYLVAEVSDLLGQGPKFSAIGEAGFDAGVYVRLPVLLNSRAQLKMRVRRKLLRQPERYAHAREPPGLAPTLRNERIHPCVYPNWDNTPRSGRRGLVVDGSTPDLFRKHLQAALSSVESLPAEQQLVFVKSWNEWAEGNYLEPDAALGSAFLRVIDEETRA
jgi:hypothetical protein